MPTITRLSSNKRQDAINLDIEGQFITTITIDTVLKFNLRKNIQVSPKKLEDLIIYSVLQKLLSLALNYISVRLRSQKEIEDYLSQKLYRMRTHKAHSDFLVYLVKENTNTLINQTIKKLTQKKYIDDYRFAKAWVEYRLSSKPRGKNYLQAELTQKGISNQIINAILEDEKILNPQQNQQMIQTLLNKALRSIKYKNYPKDKAKQVLTRRLLAKGFTYQQVQNQIDEILVKEYNDNHKTE